MPAAEMIRISAPHFTAGVVFQNDIVVNAAPILRYMMGWTRLKVELHCAKKRWTYRIKWGE